MTVPGLLSLREYLAQRAARSVSPLAGFSGLWLPSLLGTGQPVSEDLPLVPPVPRKPAEPTGLMELAKLTRKKKVDRVPIFRLAGLPNMFGD